MEKLKTGNGYNKANKKLKKFKMIQKINKGCNKSLHPRHLGFSCGDINPFNDKILYCDECEMKNNKYDGRAELGINKRLAKALNKDLVTAYEEGFNNGKLQTKEELKTQVFDKIDKKFKKWNNPRNADYHVSMMINDIKKEIKEIFE